MCIRDSFIIASVNVFAHDGLQQCLEIHALLRGKAGRVCAALFADGIEQRFQGFVDRYDRRQFVQVVEVSGVFHHLAGEAIVAEREQFIKECPLDGLNVERERLQGVPLYEVVSAFPLQAVVYKAGRCV